MLYAECEPDVPLENIDVICTVMEKLCNPPRQLEGGRIDD